MKIALFVGEITSHGLELIEHLRKDGFNCIKTVNVDEIDQTGKQSEKVIMIFTDSKFAFRFLVENKWPDFPSLNILYLHKHPIITPDSQKKLSYVNLNIFIPTEYKKLLEKMNDFLSNKKKDDTVGADIEFSVHQELGKKA